MAGCTCITVICTIQLTACAAVAYILHSVFFVYATTVCHTALIITAPTSHTSVNSITTTDSTAAVSQTQLAVGTSASQAGVPAQGIIFL
jgi:hypothetical protein